MIGAAVIPDQKSKLTIDDNRIFYAAVAILVCLLGLMIHLLQVEPINDQLTYLRIAQSIMDGEGYSRYRHPSALVMPGYPLMLAGILKLSPSAIGFYGVYIANLSMLLALAFAYGRISALWTGSRKAGRWATLVILVFPPFTGYTRVLLTEIPYACFLALALLCFEHLRAHRKTWPVWFLLGLFHAIAFMIRPVSFLLTPVILIWLLAEGRFRREVWIGGAIFVVTVLAVWSPWVVRNYRVFDAYVPLSTFSGPTLLGGSLDDFTQWKPEMDKVLAGHAIAEGPQGELQKELILKHEAKQRMKADPLRMFRLTVTRSWRYWYENYAPIYGLTNSFGQSRQSGDWLTPAARLLLLIPNLLMALGWMLAAVTVCRGPRFWPYLLLILYFWAIHSLLFPISRYSFPIVGLVLAIEVAAVYWASQKFRRSGHAETC